jgi:hypothetical protein
MLEFFIYSYKFSLSINLFFLQFVNCILMPDLFNPEQ